MKIPFVSVIVATRNRAELLEPTLDALRRQDWPLDCLELIIADNGSTDRTRDIVAAFDERSDRPTVTYVYVRESGKSHAINTALTAARGDLLAFADDDVVPEPTWIRQLAGAFAETDADFVAGRILPRWETAPPRWIAPELFGVLAVADNGERRERIGAGGRMDIMPIGANMAVRRTVVEHLGGLRQDLGKLEGTLRTGEDHEFFLRMARAGCRGVYEPTAIVHHWVPRNRLARRYFCRWLYQNGRDVGSLEGEYTLDLRRLLGVPRYLWPRAGADAGRALRALATFDTRSLLAAALHLVWFAGYLRESWFGASPAAHARFPTTARRWA